MKLHIMQLSSATLRENLVSYIKMVSQEQILK